MLSKNSVDVIHELVQRSRCAQGLPPKIPGEVISARLAALIAAMDRSPRGAPR